MMYKIQIKATSTVDEHNVSLRVSVARRIRLGGVFTELPSVKDRVLVRRALLQRCVAAVLAIAKVYSTQFREE